MGRPWCSASRQARKYAVTLVHAGWSRRLASASRFRPEDEWLPAPTRSCCGLCARFYVHRATGARAARLYRGRDKTLLSTGPGRRAVVLVDQAGGMYLYPQGGVLVPRQTPRRPPLVPGPSSTPSLPWSITSAIWRNASAASLLGSNSKIDWPLIRASATFTRCGTMVSLTSGPQ